MNHRGDAIEVRLRNGIHLPGCGLWLDPKRKAPIGVVSHAHSDHAGWHEVTIATPATMDLMRARKPPPAGITLVELAYRETFTTDRARITLIPAGHVLGSAQVLVETEEGSLLYTGDFKRGESLTCEAAASVRAGTLVTECTFGRSRYAFPPIEETRKRIVGFCNRVLMEGETPVLLAYSLGKSQELMAILSREGISPVIHESIAGMSAVYAKHGVDLGSHMVWNGRNHGGRVMIIPPNARRRFAELGNIRSAVLSGWALNADAVYRYGCHEAFPLSDHADHGELIEHAEEVGARRIYTVHGFTEEFAGDLRYLGMDALALGGGNQLELLR